MKNPLFKRWMNEINVLIYKIIGESITKLLYDENKRKSDIFNRTIYTYPAIFMVQYSLSQLLIENGIKPVYILGTSMGEFTSAVLSRVMSLEESLIILMKQAEELEMNSGSGSMIAILREVDFFYNTALLNNNSELVGANFYFTL